MVWREKLEFPKRETPKALTSKRRKELVDNICMPLTMRGQRGMINLEVWVPKIYSEKYVLVELRKKAIRWHNAVHSKIYFSKPNRRLVGK